jgi:hypothetical protein
MGHGCSKHKKTLMLGKKLDKRPVGKQKKMWKFSVDKIVGHHHHVHEWLGVLYPVP